MRIVSVFLVVCFMSLSALADGEGDATVQNQSPYWEVPLLKIFAPVTHLVQSLLGEAPVVIKLNGNGVGTVKSNPQKNSESLTVVGTNGDGQRETLALKTEEDFERHRQQITQETVKQIKENNRIFLVQKKTAAGPIKNPTAIKSTYDFKAQTKASTNLATGPIKNPTVIKSTYVFKAETKSLPNLTNTPFEQFINFTFDYPVDTPSNSDIVKFVGNKFILKRGDNVIVRVGILPSGQPMKTNGNSIVGYSENAVYYYQNDIGVLTQWDLRKNVERNISLPGPLKGFVMGNDGHLVYAAVEGVGLLKISESTFQVIRGYTFGNNSFLDHGVDRNQRWMYIAEASGLYRVDLRDDASDTFYLSATDLNMARWYSKAPRKVVDEEAIKKSVEAIVSQVKIKKFLGIQRGRALFVPMDGILKGNPLVVVRLDGGSESNNVRLIYGADGATAFYMDHDSLHLFAGSLELTFDLAEDAPIQEIGTQGLVGNDIQTAMRVGLETWAFDSKGDVQLLPIPEGGKDCGPRLEGLAHSFIHFTRN